MLLRSVIFMAVCSYAHSNYNVLYDGKVIPIPCRGIHMFVNGHNYRRYKLAKGQVPGQPAAETMKYMVWDQELAEKAKSWASVYRQEHNPDKTIGSKRFQTGENLHYYSTTSKTYSFSVDSALESWFQEHKHFSFGPIEAERDEAAPDIGHYTQMAWADTTYVGCATSKFKDGKWTRFYVVCYYGPPGNYVGQLPYEPSEKGSGDFVCTVGSNCSKPFGSQC